MADAGWSDTRGPGPASGDPTGPPSVLAVVCLRALADMGRPVPVAELVARLNPRPTGPDTQTWSRRRAALLTAVQRLADCGFLVVGNRPATGPRQSTTQRPSAEPGTRPRLTGSHRSRVEASVLRITRAGQVFLASAQPPPR